MKKAIVSQPTFQHLTQKAKGNENTISTYLDSILQIFPGKLK